MEATKPEGDLQGKAIFDKQLGKSWQWKISNRWSLPSCTRPKHPKGYVLSCSQLEIHLSGGMCDVFVTFSCFLWRIRCKTGDYTSHWWLQIKFQPAFWFLESAACIIFWWTIFDTFKLKGYQTLFLLTVRVIAMMCNRTDTEVQICLLTALYRTIFPADQCFDRWI